MAKDPFLLVSLEENESKSLAQVMSNDTARKILDYLSKHSSATESAIAKDLKMPISTVHYNLQALTKANLVEAEEFHYSEKGKEVLHYSLANKLIIIAPKKSSAESLMGKIRSLLPAGLVALATGALLQTFNWFGTKSSAAFDTGVAESAPMMLKAAAPVAEPAASSPIALWFLIGAIFALLVTFLWSYLKK